MDNIRMDLRELGWEGMDWVELALDRYLWKALVNMVMNLRVPQNYWEFPEWLRTTGSFSGRAQLRK
jgi:hypothetical protein